VVESKKRIIDIAFLIIFFFGYKGGLYILNNRLQELGFLMTLILFLYGASKLAIEKEEINWQWWFWSAPLFVGYFVIVPAVVFYLHTGSNALFSFFASREFIVAFLAPTIYFIYKLGYPTERLEAVFVVSLLLLLLNYLFFYFYLDLEAIYRKGGYLSIQISYDEWRGYRLKAPATALYILTIFCMVNFFQRVRWVKRFILLLVFCLLCYVWSLRMARNQIAAMIVSTLLYPLFFSRPNRINLIIFASPVILFLMTLLTETFVDVFMEADKIRANSYRIAVDIIEQNPLFGFGQQSREGVSYTSIFGKGFYPSDIGLIGLLFRFGIVGGMTYLFFVFYLLVRIVKVNWYFKFVFEQLNPVLWSLLIWMIGAVLNTWLKTEFAYIPGLMTGSLIIGLSACYRDKLQSSLE